MNLGNILKALAKPTPRTSDELRRDLAAIDMAAIEAKISALERQRRPILLSGSDKDLAANDDAIVAANREAERAQAAIDELKTLISEAEVREAAQQVESQADEAQRASDKLATIYAEIDSRATQVRALLGDAAAPVATLARWNKLADRLGQADRRIAYTDPLVVKRKLVGMFQ